MELIKKETHSINGQKFHLIGIDQNDNKVLMEEPSAENTWDTGLAYLESYAYNTMVLNTNYVHARSYFDDFEANEKLNYKQTLKACVINWDEFQCLKALLKEAYAIKYNFNKERLAELHNNIILFVKP